MAAGASDTFTVQLETATVGTKSGPIATNDADENPFNFAITGTVTSSGGTPEIRVTGNGYSIADGDTTPSATDWTHFGSVAQGGTAVSRPYRVLNDGTGPLTLGLLSVPEGFSIVVDLSSPVAPGSSVVFRVQLDTTVAGTKSGDISFTNSDSNENPFNFRITGTVTPGTTAPEIAVLGNSVEIADGDATPGSTDGTDFGSVVQGGAAVSRTFTVRNEGTALLTLGAVSVPTGFTVTEGLATSLAAGASDMFTVQLETGTVGTKSGPISFATNDADENPFNFAICGVVTASDDRYEDNDSRAAVDDRPEGVADSPNLGLLTDPITISNLILVDAADWYKFVMNGPGTSAVFVQLSFTDSVGNLDLEVYRADGTTLVGRSDSTGNQETVSLNNQTVGTYYARVYGAANPAYTLTIEPAPDWFAANLEDAGLRSLAADRTRDGQLSRTDAIEVLHAAKDGSTVDADELHDLRALVASAAGLGMPDYVRGLADNVVNHEVANAHYQGGALGDLAAGSTDTHLESLIGKWFYGTDHPVAGAGTTYRTISGSLFQGGPSPQDVNQGALGDCYFLASLAATAQQSPTTITSMFIDNGDDTFTVRFYNNSVVEYVTVDRQLPTNASSRLIYDGRTRITSIISPTNELWSPLAEKAYAQINECGWLAQDNTNTYAGISGGMCYLAIRHVTGRAAALTNTLDYTQMVNAWNEGQVIVIDCMNTPPDSRFVFPHSYALVGYDAATDRFTAYNPWGGAGGLITNLSWDDIHANFDRWGHA
ncbi:MAG: choice-of-anchor D domain-containing protein [Planctomycetes bacterium]|nr:choice-of-anchor D domain-containing protein [Planctomycetota bacterium]